MIVAIMRFLWQRPSPAPAEKFPGAFLEFFWNFFFFGIFFWNFFLEFFGMSFELVLAEKS